MASTGQSNGVQATAAHDAPRPAQAQDDAPTSSNPTEMSSSPPSNYVADTQLGEGKTAAVAQKHDAGPSSSDPSGTDEKAQEPGHESFPSSLMTATPKNLTRSQSTAIGPCSDDPVPVEKNVEPKGPSLMITLLLIDGARHPFKLDGKYLQKRNVEVQDNDPFNLSVYKLKELILREWRQEWETKPSSPSSIRLISFGKLLDDKAALRDSKFNSTTANVVHMSIKPQDMLEEEEAAAAKGGKKGHRGIGGIAGIGGGGGGGGDGEDRRSHGCRCVIL